MNKQSGFTYLTILFAIVVAGILLSRTGIDWSQSGQREKERELLFVGSQFRQAIASYYHHTPGVIKRYPAKLDDLLSDTRYNPPQHYLRKLYRDPITNRADWEMVLAPEGGVMGVHSHSDAMPLKKSGFREDDKKFEGAQKYAEWIFFYVPPGINPPPLPPR